MNDRKALLDRIKQATQYRFEPKTLKKDFRIRLKNLELVCVVAAAPGKPDGNDQVRLFLNPVPCGPTCSDTCGCCYSWFGDPKDTTDREQADPLTHVVPVKSKLAADNNTDQLSALLSEFKTNGNGSGSAETPDISEEGEP